MAAIFYILATSGIPSVDHLSPRLENETVLSCMEVLKASMKAGEVATPFVQGPYLDLGHSKRAIEPSSTCVIMPKKTKD